MMDKILIKIFQELNEEDYVSSNDMSILVGLSDKTIRKRIKELNELLKNNGASIETKRSLGSKIIVTDSKLFNKFRKSVIKFKLYDNTQNLKQLIQIFVQSKDYLKAEDLADNLFVSKSTLTKYLNKLRVYINQYNLELDVRPHHGMKLKGSEFNLRRLIASNFVQNYQNEYSKHQVKSAIDIIEFRELNEVVSKIVRKEVVNYKINITGIALESLISHIVIALIRVKQNMIIDADQELSIIDLADPYYKTIQTILKKILGEVNITLPHSEVMHIMMHFRSKTTFSESESDQIPKHVNELVDRILKKIYQERNISLFKNLDLRTMLGLHMVPLLYRLNFGTYLKNPILNEVKLACISGYDLAVIAATVIEDETGIKMEEDEISYLAMHFDVALKQDMRYISKKNVLIVCSTGRTSARLLKMEFEQYFGQYVKSIDTCDVSEVEIKDNIKDYDFIFSTVPIKVVTKAPIFEFDFYLSRDSVKSIEKVLTRESGRVNFVDIFRKDLFFVYKNSDCKKNILDELIRKTMEVEKLPQEFYDLVWEREQFSSTDILPMIAIPHPNKLIHNRTFIACMILDKPVNWGNHKVSIIFLLNMAKEHSEKYTFIYDWLIQLSSSRETLLKIHTDKSYETLIKSLNELTNERKN